MSPQIRQAEIRQEARFVLWALRCAVARLRGDADIEKEIDRGFELADVLETREEFWRFARALVAVPWSGDVWHDPGCCCASTEELLVLQSLAEVAERFHCGHMESAGWWRMILPVGYVDAVDTSARGWITALYRSGVVFPRMNELIESLGPVGNIAQPAGNVRLN